MPYRIRTEKRPAAAGLDGTVYILEDDGGTAQAEVWPGLGFNCYRWSAALTGKMLDLLYADPHFFEGEKPTRSGIPILFPFPNRIRDGSFTWEGKAYHLPLNDASGKNAIHGFPCRRAWRIADQGVTESEAWITGVFRGATDAADARALWPADYEIHVTYRLSAQKLRIETRVENVDCVTLPFGLGFHPYFRIPLTTESRVDDCLVEAPAHAYWELSEGVPNGIRRPVDAARNLVVPRSFAEVTLDDILTEVENKPNAEGLCLRGSVRETASGVVMRLLTSASFRELVVFTPPHRQAFALEPYTCTTDAINLQQRGVDAGLLVLQPGTNWTGSVEMVIQAPLAS